MPPALPRTGPGPRPRRYGSRLPERQPRPYRGAASHVFWSLDVATPVSFGLDFQLQQIIPAPKGHVAYVQCATRPLNGFQQVPVVLLQLVMVSFVKSQGPPHRSHSRRPLAGEYAAI